MNARTGIAHFTLATRDVERAAAFFSETLGWKPILRPRNIECRAAWLEIAPGVELHLLEIDGFEPSPFEAEFGRHFAVSYPASGFADLKHRLASRGAEIIAARRPTPFERFFFRDPDGYVFEVVAAERMSET